MSIQAEVAKVGLCISMQKMKIMEIGANAVGIGRCLIDGEEYVIADDLSILEIQYLQMSHSLRKGREELAKQVDHFPVCCQTSGRVRRYIYNGKSDCTMVHYCMP